MLLLGTATYADLDKKSTRDYQVGWTQSAQDLMLADVGMACRAFLGCLKQCSAGLDTGQSHRVQRVPDNLPHRHLRPYIPKQQQGGCSGVCFIH